MKIVRKLVVFVIICSLLMSTWASADSPIDTIIDTAPGTTGFGTLTSGGTDVVVTDETYTKEDGGWLMDIINGLLGILSGGLLYPIFAVLGVDHIPKLVFNKEPLTRLSFFDTASSGDLANILMKQIAPIYVAFRYIAIICYVAIILYLAVRILLSTVSRQKAMYKELLKHWVSGVVILLTFNWLMTYTIVLSDTLVEILATAVGYGTSGTSFPIGSFGDVISMGILSLVYMTCLLGMCIAVWWTYIKRLFTVAFLIMLFPLVTITYVFDKIGDRKSQILGTWIKEFMTNVFVQPIQALALILIMIAMKSIDGMSLGVMLGPIIKLILLFMLFPAEKLLKKIFDVNPSIGGKGFAGSGAGLLAGMQMAGKAAPVLGNNIKNFKNMSTANMELKKAKMDHAAGKIDGGKLALAEEKARVARGRTVELATGSIGTAFGAGLTGNFGSALAIGAGMDKMTRWGAESGGARGAQKEIGNLYDGMIAGVKDNNLTDEQRKTMAKQLKMSEAELKDHLKDGGGRAFLMDKLDSEKNAALAHLKMGEAGAEYERSKFNNSMKLGSDGTVKRIGEDGSEIAAGKMGSIRKRKNSLSALDKDGNMLMHLLDPDGKEYRDSKFTDDQQVDYGYRIGDDTSIDLDTNGMRNTAKEKARQKAIESSGASIEAAANKETRQQALDLAKSNNVKFEDNDAKEAYVRDYMASDAGKEAYQKNYDVAVESSAAYQKNYNKEIEVQEKIVTELREATGIQTLQVTSISTPAAAPVAAPPAPAAAPTAAPATGGTIPQAAPVAAPPVNMDQLANAISSAIQTSMTSFSNTASTAMAAELSNFTTQVTNAMKNVTPGSGNNINLEGIIKNELQGVSSDMARTLQTAATDYTNAVNQAQQSAAGYLQQFGASSSSSNDSGTELQIRYSEEAAKVIESSRESRRKLGLDAI